MTVVDFHFHVYRGEQYYAWVVDWIEETFRGDFRAYVNGILSPQAVTAFLDQMGVDYAVALTESDPITTGVITNEEVARFCQGIDRLIPFCDIDPHLVAHPAAELERCVRELGFKGLKLYPTYKLFYPNDPLLYPVYAKAEELQIPVMIHTGSSVFRGSRLRFGDPLYLDEVAVDFPYLTLIQVHSGRGFWYDRAFFLARFHENVYMEVAGLPPQNLLAYFPDLEENADKVLFGSDWPTVQDIKANIQAVRDLPISQEAKAKILGENAARILGLPTGNPSDHAPQPLGKAA